MKIIKTLAIVFGLIALFESTGFAMGRAPSHLTTQAVTSTKVRLNWSDNSKESAGFYVHRSTSATSGFQQVGTTAADVATFTDKDLVVLTTYFYKVEAINGDGTSAVAQIQMPALYASGSGTSTDPIFIQTALQLANLGERPTDWSRSFVLGSDIDLAQYPCPLFNPIGAGGANPFRGTFDGANHTIRNFKCDSSVFDWYGGYRLEGVGLFGMINGATIKNLKLRDISVSGDFVTGGLVGQQQSGWIINSSVSGSILGNEETGGLVGLSGSGYITGSQAAVNITAGAGVGGLVGDVGNTQIIYSCASGQINAFGQVGGLVGLIGKGRIANSYANVDISIPGENFPGQLAGGFLGMSNAPVINSFSTGRVTGGNAVGGFDAPPWVGSTLGVDTGSFWNTTTSGLTTSYGAAIGLNDQQMKTASNFIGAGWSPYVWRLENGSYPTFLNYGNCSLPVTPAVVVIGL